MGPGSLRPGWAECGFKMRGRPLGPYSVGGVVCAVALLVVFVKSGHRVKATLASFGALLVFWRLRARLHRAPKACKLRKSVHFNMRVGCMSVPNLLDLPENRKAALWWQPDDFAEFLKVRLEIAKAYKTAAQSLGVEMPSVCSVGPHARRAYVAMVEAYPSLKDESRRGLGLGRKRQRAKNRDAYIAAVVKEQQRQHDLSHFDEEAIAAVAMRVSQQDRDYAHFLAKMYFEQDRADEAGTTIDADITAALFNLNNPASIADDRGCSKETIDDEENSPSRQHTQQQPGEDRYTEEEVKWEGTPQGTHSVALTKGWGLSKDKLQAAGLSATGHSLLKRSRDAPCPQEDSELSSAESDGVGSEYD
ncbi:cgt [Symbiodinium necroappetens]|uniref:Cgt protein n=1 Tax=Symbiodinium necroappetens TaxID=1628268 RepID=A0A812R6C8_9DINO|nr:cgt [Symbiodinium necroappetens]